MDAIEAEDHQIAHSVFSLRWAISNGFNQRSIGDDRAPPPQSRQADLFSSLLRHTRKPLHKACPRRPRSRCALFFPADMRVFHRTNHGAEQEPKAESEDDDLNEQ